MAKRNMKVVAVGKYARNTSDIASALEVLQKADPQAVIMVGAYAPSAEFIKQARKSNFNPVFMNISFVGTQKLVESLGREGDGVYITQVMPSPHDTTLPLIRSYLADVASSTLPGLNPSRYGTLEGYVNARVLTHMLASVSTGLSRASLISSSESLGVFHIEGLDFSFSSSSHQGSRKVYLTRIVSGSVVPVSF